MTDVRGSVRLLVEQLMADGELDDEDLARIAEATAAARRLIGEEKAWRETAHVHDVPHVSVVTLDEVALKAYLAAPEHRMGANGRREMVPPAERVPELTDASGMVCHDCGRALVSDRGSIRILVCPSLHGRRPPELIAVRDGAVECGRPPR